MDNNMNPKSQTHIRRLIDAKEKLSHFKAKLAENESERTLVVQNVPLEAAWLSDMEINEVKDLWKALFAQLDTAINRIDKQLDKAILEAALPLLQPETTAPHEQIENAPQ